MSTLTTFEVHGMADKLATHLRIRKVYATVAGDRRNGYQILVNEKDLGTANEAMTAWLSTPEVKQ